MVESGEVEENKEVNPRKIHTNVFGTRYKASFESAHFSSQSRWGMSKFDSAMEACVLDPTFHDQKNG